MIIENGILKKIEENDVENGIVSIPEGVTEIGSQLISGEDYLKRELDLGDLDTLNQQEEEKNLFPHNIKIILIPKTVIKIDKMAFMGLKSIEEIIFEKGIKIEDIGANAFNGCPSLREITIPETVELIDVDAFRGCSSITNLTFPKGSTVILSESSFNNCDSLEELHFLGKAQTCEDDKEAGINLISKNLQDITVFQYNTIGMVQIKLKKITLPQGIRKIEKCSFYKCDCLKEVRIQNGLEFIGEEAFACCHALENITIPESVTYIGQSAFAICYNLKRIRIPVGVEKIRTGTFQSCFNLLNVNIMDGVHIIEHGAFWKCYKLNQVNIPRSMEKIEKYAFVDCTALKTIKVFWKTVVESKAFDRQCFKIRYFLGRGQTHDDDGR